MKQKMVGFYEVKEEEEDERRGSAGEAEEQGTRGLVNGHPASPTTLSNTSMLPSVASGSRKIRKNEIAGSRGHAIS